MGVTCGCGLVVGASIMADGELNCDPCSSCNSAYKHCDSSIAGPGVDLSTEHPLYDSCTCTGQCVAGTTGEETSCLCLKRCRPYDTASGSLRNEFLSNITRPVFECNSCCSCTADCINRASQRSPLSTLSVRSAGLKGAGVFADKEILKGTFVMEYAGEIVSLTTAKERLQRLGESESCYLVVFREHFGSDRIVSTCVDASRYGNIARFINHSCAPNLTMVAVRTDSVVPRLCLFSNRDIVLGEEICFSYFGGQVDICKLCYNLGKRACLCGAKNCVGFLPLEIL